MTRNTPTAARWTLREISLLRQHYPVGGSQAVQTAGVKRERTAITRKANDLRVTTKLARSLLGDAEPHGGTLLRLPRHPRHIADALEALASTPGLTLDQYERRKARILRGETT